MYKSNGKTAKKRRNWEERQRKKKARTKTRNEEYRKWKEWVLSLPDKGHVRDLDGQWMSTVVAKEFIRVIDEHYNIN